MDKRNDALINLVIQIDPDAKSWAYNRYCSSCGRFLYSDTKCKKCGTSATNPILIAIPLLTSATAIEKLITWAKRNSLTLLINEIGDIINRWLYSDMNVSEYRIEIIEHSISILAKIASDSVPNIGH